MACYLLLNYLILISVLFCFYSDNYNNSKKGKRRTSRELKKTVEHESDGYTNGNWCSWYNHQRIIQGTGGLGNNRTSEDNPNYSIGEIDLYTEKSPGDLLSLRL